MEFHFVMSEYNRMKNWYEKNLKPDPMRDKKLDEWLKDAQTAAEFELMVMDWSTKHPKPKYPTIGDLVNDIINIDGNPAWRTMKIEEILQQEIPEEAAIEYGIAPLDLFGIEKYVGSEWR